MDIIHEAFNCPECRLALEKPVTLICGSTVCLKHLENLENDIFFCKSCQKYHAIEKNSINVNKGYDLLIKANIKNINLGDEYNEAFDSCNKLDQLSLEMRTITSDPGYYINELIGKLRNKTELIREHYKMMIDAKASQIISDLDKYEQKCRKNLESADFITKLNQMIDITNETRTKLVEWKKVLNDFGSNYDEWESIQKESKKFLFERSADLFNFKNQLLNDSIEQYFSNVLDTKNITLTSDLKIEDGLQELEELIYNFKNSKIVDETNKRELLTLCNFSPDKRWKLIYRASECGGGAKMFHKFCDNIPNTVTIIKSTCGSIFGGYTSQAWDKSNEYKTDPKAFLFSLVNPENKPVKLNVLNSSEAIYCSEKNGPTFGSNPDLCVWDKSIKLIFLFSSSCLGKCYPKRFTGQKFYEHLCENEKFTEQDIDIYQIV